MSEKKNKSWEGMRYVLLFLCLLSLSATAFLLYDYSFYKDKVYNESKKKFHTITVKTAQELDNLAEQVMESAESVAASLTDGSKKQKNIHKVLKKELKKNPNFSGARIAFQPVTYDPNIKLHSAGWQRIEDEKDAAVMPVENDTIDDFFSCWYLTPIHEKKNRWSDPYWDKARAAWLITYSALFYRQDSGETEKKPAGVVAIDLSLKYLGEIIHKNIESSGKGFGGLTTGDGKYIYHPRNEYVTSGKTLLELAEEKKDSDRLTLNEKAKERQSVILNHTSTTTGEKSWLIAEPVQHSGWSVQNTFIKNDVSINTNILRNRLITAALCGVVSVLSVLLFLLTVMSFPKKTIWCFVAVTSIVLTAAIGIVWRTALTYPEYQDNGPYEIKNKEFIDRYLYAGQYNSFQLIPTGLYVESLELNGNELAVSGHIWQKYPIQDKEVQGSFYLYPTKSFSVEQTDIDEEGDSKIVISYFNAKIPLTISYSKYPLEVEEMFFKILPRDSDNIFFVPDFSSGHFDAAVRFPALSENITLAAWEIKKTFFAFEKKDFRLNFGVPDYNGSNFSALSFRIAIKRHFLNAFLSNITPLIVVSIILFFILLLPADTDIAKVLGICSSLFLVVAFAHLGIRKSLATGELFYLEYFYFVIYLVILLTPIKKLLLSLELKSCILTEQDGLFFKMIYWPFLLSLLLLVTVLKFY